MPAGSNRITIECPHCHKPILAGGNGNGRKKFGSPIRNCPFCGNIYADDYYVEPVWLSRKERKQTMLSWQDFVGILFGAISLLMGIIYRHDVPCMAGIFLTPIFTINLIQNLKFDPETDEDFQRELLASKQRVSDPKYIITLWEHGYPVPSELFDNAKQILNYKTKGERYREQMQSDQYDPERYKCASFKFLSKGTDGTCGICFRKGMRNRYKVKNDIGCREVSLCDICVARFKRHNDFDIIETAFRKR